MLERIKKALVESFVGVIVVGSLFASGILSFVGGITTPFATWLTEWIQQAKGSVLLQTPPPQFPFLAFVREWITAVLILLVAFLLLRWLYIEPCATVSSDPTQMEKKEEGA
jgi:large-conductance mechanosensitive channel